MTDASDLCAVLNTKIPSSMDEARSLASELGIPANRVVRRALAKGAAAQNTARSGAATSLLRDAVAEDEDTGGWSTGELLARLAKGEDPDSVVTLMDLALESDVAIPIDIVGDICDSFAEKGRTDLVRQGVAYLNRTHQPVNAIIYSTILKSYAQANDPKGALAAYREIPCPVPFHLSILVECLARNGRPREALDELDRFATANPGEAIMARLIGRAAGALAELDAAAGVDELLELLEAGGGGRLRPPMLTPVLKALNRGQEHEQAVRLFGHLADSRVRVSDLNLEVLVTCLRGIREPSELLHLLPQLGPLLRPRHWATLLSQNMPRSDLDSGWLQLVRAASACAEEAPSCAPVVSHLPETLGSQLVSALRHTTYADLLRIAVHSGDRGALRWLLQCRVTVTRRDFDTALQHAVNVGDAEFARLVVSDMFARGVAPDIDSFRSVASSYSGSLGEVLGTFDDLAASSARGNPEGLARILVTAVLTEYAATNQARQWGGVLAKFEGWPKPQDWKGMKRAFETLVSSRPRDAATAVRSLMPDLGPPPPHLLGKGALLAARTGDLLGVRGLLELAHETLETPATLTRRRVALLTLTDQYYRLGGARRSHFLKPPRSNAPGDNWLPNVQHESELVNALLLKDRVKTRQAYEECGRETLVTLPLPALIAYMLVAKPEGDALEAMLLALRIRFPDATFAIEETLDQLDAVQGNNKQLLLRLLMPGSLITLPKVRAYATEIFGAGQDCEQAVARFQALSRGVPDDQRAQLLLRSFAEIRAIRAEPDAVRRLFDDLSVLTTPGPRAWAELQRAARSTPEGPARVLEEMLKAGITPELRNLRPVVAGLGKIADFAAADRIIERFGPALSDLEKAALLSELVVSAASIDQLDRAERIRDQIWRLSQSLTPGADAAWHAARVRAGLERPLTGADGESVQLTMDIFIRDIAHDLENLLGSVWPAIDFALELLESGDSPEKAVRQLTPARDVTKPKFDRLMEHWQTMADDDARSGEQADVGRAVRQLFRLKQEVAEAAEVRLESRIPEGQFFVKVSAIHLDIILRQLIDNAIRHLALAGRSDRYVRVLVTDVADSNFSIDDPQVRISIFDNGPGIPIEHRGAIYESGFSTKSGRGVGRGLALVNSVVAMVGGAISVESRAASDCDSGKTSFTQFNITLPRTLGERDRSGDTE